MKTQQERTDEELGLAPCELCGTLFKPGSIVGMFRGDDGNLIGGVCPECLNAGKEGVKDRIRDAIKHHERELQRLKGLGV